eukprot:m.221415 g.221415  ORF g.221415 m.221415 type:complete len:102 (-) comp10577_c0_seq1:62-367(-)
MAAAVRRIKPLFDRVIVEKIVPEVKTKSGILLPDAATSPLNEAVVIATGPGAPKQNGELSKVVVNVGDRVLLPEFGGTKVTIDSKEFFIYRDSDLLGVFSN